LGVGEQELWPGMTRNVEAYDAYLAGVALHHEHLPDSMRRAIDPFQRALALDPAFAQAWASLAWLYSDLARLTSSDLASEAAWLEKRDAAIAAARRLTPDSSTVNALLAFRSLSRGEWVEAERQYAAARATAERQGLKLAIDKRYGQFLLLTGRARDAVGIQERAKSLDPLDTWVAIYLAEALANAGNLPAAIAEQDRGLQLQAYQATMRPVALITALATGDRALIERRLGPDVLVSAVITAMRPFLDRLAEALAEQRSFAGTAP